MMKGARSGVQKLIKDENPFLYGMGCICHLVNLAVKAGMEALPVDIDQLFVDIFITAANVCRTEFRDLWCFLFTTEPSKILKHCTTRWLSLLRCVRRFINMTD